MLSLESRPAKDTTSMEYIRAFLSYTDAKSYGYLNLAIKIMFSI